MTPRPPRDVLAIIPARGGSKGIPRKNIVVVAGKPLLQWTIDAALAAACVTRVVVSTEDEEIAAIARSLGAEVPALRPASLAADDTAGIAPIIDMIIRLAADEPWTCVLQPTSPLRLPEDIDGARQLAEERDADAVLGVTAVRQHVAWHKQLDASGWIAPAPTPPTTRQALAERWCPTGAIYLARTSIVRDDKTLTPPRTASWQMPSSRALDIDIPDDLIIAEALLQRRAR